MNRLLTTTAALAAIGFGCVDEKTAGPMGGPGLSADLLPASQANVLTIEHSVPFVSTVPANAGQNVELSVLERVRPEILKTGSPDVVLFIHGNSFPGELFDFDVQPYDWMLAVAKAGFDAFEMDNTGFGFSPRPEMEDPCNVDVPTQKAILIPNGILKATCAPSYPFKLTTSRSDRDEIDRVVDYLRALRGVDRVDIIAWSLGGWRATSYGALHPEKVNKLVLLAPVYQPTQPDTAPTVQPEPGLPMTLGTRASQYGSLWNPDIHCANQVEAGIQDAHWNATMAVDPLGQLWGAPDGVMRIRSRNTLWGFNRASAVRFTSSPVLIISGEFDNVVPIATETLPLYNDYGTSQKVHVTVQCASHFMPFEGQARNLHELSLYYLRHGTVDGVSHGRFYMDTTGTLTPIN